MVVFSLSLLFHNQENQSIEIQNQEVQQPIGNGTVSRERSTKTSTLIMDHVPNYVDRYSCLGVHSIFIHGPKFKNTRAKDAHCN